MKTIIGIAVLVALVLCAIPLTKNVLWRSKDKDASLFYHMNGGEGDCLGRMTPSALEGLDEANEKLEVNHDKSASEKS